MFKKHLKLPLLIGLVISLLFVPAQLSNIASSFDKKFTDSLIRQLPQPFEHQVESVIILIDQNSIDYFRQQAHILWPWPREYYGKMVDYLKASGAKQVVFDLYFSEEDIDRLDISGEESDSAFAKACEKMKAVFQAVILRKDKNLSPPLNLHGLPQIDGTPSEDIPLYHGITLPIEPLFKTAQGLGMVNVTPDGDGVVRRISLAANYSGKTLPHMGLLVSNGGNFGRLVIDGNHINDPSKEKAVKVPVNHTVHWYKSAFDTVPAADVIQSTVQLSAGVKPLVPVERFKDKVVFIGSNAPALFDLKTTPHKAIIPGVEVLATLTENLIHGHWLKPAATGGTLLIVVLIFLLALVLQMTKKVYWHITMLMGFGALYTLVICFAYTFYGLLMPVVLPFSALFLVFVATQTTYYLGEGKKKRQLKKMFDHYLDSTVVSHLLKNPNALKLGGERKELTVFFSDIAGFTTLSENMAPERLVEFLNEYLGEMSSIIMDCGGYLDKYIGDAIMAVFGAPAHQKQAADQACQAALDNIRRLEELKKDWGEESADFNIRIGISTGEMVVGNIGCHSRMDYTVIGDTVNLGARLEGVNKQFDTNIIIDETTKRQLSNSFATRELDLVAVKGKTRPVKIFELLFSDFNSKLLKIYNQGRQLYQQREWIRALAVFEEAAEQFPNDGPARVYLERCRQYIDNPPSDDWDGVHRLSVK